MSYRRVMVICALHDPNGKQKSVIQKTYALSGKSPFAYDDKASTFTKWDPLPVPGDYLIFYVLVDSKRICKTNLKLGRDIQIGTEFFRWFPLNYAHKNFPWQVDSQEAKGFLCIRINFETTAPFAFRTDYQNGHTLRFEVEETQDDKMVAMLPVEDMKKQMNCCCIS
mmetsp:Transcript_21588/g.34874  ORF Transcript_21588/g.34874 Transcript_21588/m.34874 type:complete len:167 (+) Transcript_21588:37-537(+)